MDSKSPGLSGRLVQYNNEVEVQKATHQAKYGRPGVFPIVHLFKKDTPIISPKPRRVTVRMASAGKLSVHFTSMYIVNTLIIISKCKYSINILAKKW